LRAEWGLDELKASSQPASQPASTRAKADGSAAGTMEGILETSAHHALLSQQVMRDDQPLFTRTRLAGLARFTRFTRFT
jgi:hypothetical protein